MKYNARVVGKHRSDRFIDIQLTREVPRQSRMVATTASEATVPLTYDELQELKKEVEAKTGKTYKIREPRQNINDLIALGAIQDAPTSLWEALKMGFSIALVMILSFGVYYVLFFQYPSKNYKGKSDLFKPKPNMPLPKPKLYPPLLQEEPMKPAVREDEL